MGQDVELAIRRAIMPLESLITSATVASHLDAALHIQNIVGRTSPPGGFRFAIDPVYRKAVDFTTRRLNLTARQLDFIEQAYGKNAGRLADELTSLTAKEAARVVSDAIASGVPSRRAAKELNAWLKDNGMAGEDPWRLQTMFRTQTAMAYEAGRWSSLQSPVASDIIWGFEYVTVGDDRVRPNHAAMDGIRLPKEDAFWQANWPPNGWNSFAPWTHVAGEFVSGSKARYAGSMIEIQTRHGARLTVTPNHPVLTTRGFVPAKDVREGDDLLRYDAADQRLVHAAGDRRRAFPSTLDGRVDDEQIPSSIKNVFDALLPHGARSRLPRRLPLDFHGDGACYEGDIDVVDVDWPFSSDVESVASQRSSDGHLMLAAVPTPFVRKRGGVLSRAGSVRVGASPQFDAMRLQSIRDDRSRALELLRQLQHGNAGEVRLDKIISRNVRSWHGHVYDLQSPNGTIVADGLIVSNCRCSTIEILFDDPLAEDAPPPSGVVDVGGVETRAQADEGWGFNPGAVYETLRGV